MGGAVAGGGRSIYHGPAMATPEHRPDLRASDSDREAVANQLRTASEDGRLDVDELDDRLAKVYAAKTYGELEPLTADLAPDPPPRPSALANWRVRWGSWAATSVLLVGIWAIIYGHPPATSRSSGRSSRSASGRWATSPR